MLQLNNLDKLTKKRKTIGRGGSRGGTSGKGGKGQKARSGGKVPARFEGGQMSITRRLPKRGFTNALFKTKYSLITLSQLNEYFDDGMMVTKDMLHAMGCIKSHTKVKLLGTGVLEKKLTVSIDACSKSAQKAIEHRGGEVKLIQE